MGLRNATAEIYAPDGAEPAEALARTTHMAVVAHQDDAEVVAADGILACYDDPDRWLTAVVVTGGGGSPRTGAYEHTTDDEMRAIRRGEQKAAADLGRYGAVVFLDYPSDAVRATGVADVVDDLAALAGDAAPDVVYTHNLADRHHTHVAVALRTIEALRLVAPERRPGRVLGCEAWRDLDWLPASDKVLLDVSARPDLQAALLGAFASQTAGKRYDLAALGRRRAHATFLDPYAVDAYAGLALAMDLTPLVADPARDVEAFTDALVDGLKAEIRAAIAAVK